MLTLRTSRANGAGLESRLNQLFNDTFSAFDWPYRDSASATWMPAVDIAEHSDRILIQMEVPGVSPENVKIAVEDNVLTISGSKERASEEATELHRYERTYGAFERTFKLPASVDVAAIKAAQEHGVLTVTLPKVEKAKPRQIQVEVSKR